MTLPVVAARTVICMAKQSRSGISKQVLDSLAAVDGEAVGRLAAEGQAAIESYARAKVNTATTKQAKAVAKHEKALAKHERRITTMKSTAQLAWATSAVATVGAGVSVANDGTWFAWAVTAGASGWIGLRQWARADRARTKPPVAPDLPVLVPSLPSSATGAPEAARLIVARRRLDELLPALESLHPPAAQELRAADREAAPVLAQTIERLGVLDQIARTMPGTPAAEAAVEGAGEVRRRLLAGVDTYERLISAAATVIAAPDLTRSSEAVLGPAIDAMQSYAYGLTHVSDVLDR